MATFKERVLSQGKLMWNIEVLALTVKKLLERLKFQKELQNEKQDKNNIPLIFDLGVNKLKNNIVLFPLAMKLFAISRVKQIWLNLIVH